MKSLLTAILLLITSFTFAQEIQVSSAIGYGISINSQAPYDYTLFQSAIIVTPKLVYERFEVGGQSIATTSDSTTTMFNGAYARGLVWKQGNKSLSIGGHYLLGFEGDVLWGGSVSYDVGTVGFDAILSQQVNSKQFVGIGTLRYTFFK